MIARAAALLVASVVAGLAGTAGAQEPSNRVPADRPSPRTDANSKLAHAQLLEKAREGRIDVYFAGDSITRRWGATDYPELLANWTQNFHGWNAANFGWGGDGTQHILWRLENGELDDVHPRVIVLLAGTNNLGTALPPGGEDEKAADVARGVEAIVRTMRRKAPDSVIVLMAILPRNGNMALMSTIEAINRRLAPLADGRTIRFLSINDRLADETGRLREGMTADGLHLTAQGYQVWADALKPILTELLGPPAAEDHAPAPTGDPSAS